MNSTNMKIRVAMLEASLPQWKLAVLLGMHEGSLSRKMRYEMTEEEQDRIVKLIKEAENNGTDK